MKKSDLPIVVKVNLNHSSNIVWQAITQHDQMIQWYFEQLPAFKPEVGFQTEFVVTNEGRTFTHQWEVTEVVPGKQITYTWSFPEYPGLSTSTFELIDLPGDGTQLILTVLVMEDFPDDIPEFRRESCIGGWDYFLGERLLVYLNN